MVSLPASYHILSFTHSGAGFSLCSPLFLTSFFPTIIDLPIPLSLRFCRYANLTNPPDWFRHDFGKPEENISTHSTFFSKLTAAWVRTNATGGGMTEFLLSSAIVDDKGNASFAHEQYGAPEVFITQLVVAHKSPLGAPRISVTIWCVNKTATRLPETMFVSFTPDNSSATSISTATMTTTTTATATATATATTASWEMQKLGQWQATDDVVAGGSRRHHKMYIACRQRIVARHTFEAPRYSHIRKTFVILAAACA